MRPAPAAGPSRCIPAADGLRGGLLAAAVAFAPSFAFVLGGGPRFQRLRANPSARAFLDGAGPSAIGAILGSSVPLARALSEFWQYPVLAAAAVALVVFRRGVVPTLWWRLPPGCWSAWPEGPCHTKSYSGSRLRR